VAFAGGLVCALDESSVRDEVLNAGEAFDVVYLVEYDEREYLADTVYGTQ